MASQIRHLRSGDADKRPAPEEMVFGQLAVNYSTGSPAVFFKDSAGGIIKAGPIHVGTTAPNATPAGSAGNSVGEGWLDTSATPPILKVWNGGSWVAAVTPAAVPAATETVSGIAQLATQAEVDAGTNATDIVTPAKLRAASLGPLAKHSDVVDTAATTGQALTWNGTAWAPASASASAAASETVAGIAQLATQAEVDAGTNATDIVTPAKLRAATLGVLSKHSDVVDTAATTGQALTWNGTAWAPAAVVVPAASETVSGIAQLATQAEVDAGTNATDIVTPAKLRAATLGVLSKHSDVATTAPASGQTLSWNGTAWAPATQPANPVQATTTVAGIAQLATQAEVDAGTNATDIVTPATLRAATLGVLSKHSDVATTAPTSGQTLSWNGTAWAPATQPANPVQATTTVLGTAMLATQAEVDAGTVTTDIVTPATLKATTVFDTKYVNSAGDTMTGALVVPNATLGTQALNMNTADGRYVNVTGDTMTGNLTVANSAGVIMIGGGASCRNGNSAINKAAIVNNSTLDSNSGALQIQSVSQSEYWQFLQGGDGTLIVGTTVGIKGSFNFSNGVYSPVSDAKLKSSVNGLDPAESLRLIGQLVPSRYVINGKDSLGFIAQEVEPLFPVLVNEVNLPDPQDINSSVATKTMDYMGLAAPIVAAIQALTSRLEALETRLATLEAPQG